MSDTLAAPRTGLDAALRRRTLWVTGGRILFLGLWFVAITASYRHIGALPGGLAQAGMLAFLLAGIKVFSSALSDALDMDVVRRVPVLLAEKPAEAAAVWLAAQQIRLGLGLVVVLLTLGLAVPVARIGLGDAALAPMVRIAGLVAALELLFRGHLSDMQSRERFGRFLALEGGLQVLRICLLVWLALAGGLTAQGFLLAYGGATLMALLAGTVVSGASRMRLWRWSGTTSRETWSYLRWVAPAMLLSAVMERMDLFLLTGLRGPAEAGLYGALLPLLLVPEVAVGFAMGVLQPRVADMQAQGTLKGFWAAVCRLTVPMAVAGTLLVALLAEPLIVWTIGPAYLAAAPVLRILFLASMAWFAVVPVAVSFVVMTEPRATLAISIVQAMVIAVAWLLLIPSLGAVGAALSALVMRLAAGSMICGLALHRLGRQ